MVLFVNALEKARLAKEAERQEKEATRGANKFVIFGALMIIIAIGVCLFAIITIINQVKGLTILTNDALSTLKTSFYISLGIFVCLLSVSSVNSISSIALSSENG